MPTTILTNARFYTVDPNRPLAEAVAVQDGRIVAVGALPKVKGQVQGPYRKIDLAGHPVIPAFTDAHIHLAMYCLRRLEVDLSKTQTVDEAVNLIAERARTLPPGSWVRGGGWDKNKWPGAAPPLASAIDQVCPDHPVAVSSKDEHALWANSMAMRLAGLDQGAPDVPGGGLTLENGLPAGVFLERAMDLIYRVMPPIAQDEIEAAIREGQKDLHAVGVTAVHVPEGPAVFSAVNALRERGEMGLRVYMMIPADEADHALALGLRTGFGDDILRVGPVKIFADGALGSGTAHLLEPYETLPGHRGLEVTGHEEIRDLVVRCADGGLASAIHAIGDAANRSALHAFKDANCLPWSHRIEHAQLIHPDDMHLFADLKITASVQPCHLLTDWPMVDNHWGQRGQFAFALKTLLRSGVNLAFGSDAPVEPVNPLRGLYAAVTRERSTVPTGSSWYPGECLEVIEAVHAYTAGPVRAEIGGARRGMLKEGFWADLAVLSHDIFEEPESLAHAQVLATFLGGEPVYDIV